MKMKKVTAAILAVSVLAGMTACSTEAPQSAEVNVIGNETTAAPVESATEAPAETSAETPAETSAETSSETSAETEAAETEAPAEIEEDTSDAVKTKGEYYTYSDEVDFDLNSDGENEKIFYSIVSEDDLEYAEIAVNDSTYQVYFPTENYLICDIDPTDKYFEIAMSSTGMSSDFNTEFLRYDNGELYSIGSVDDSIDGSAEFNFSLVDSFGKSLQINGDGTVTAAKRLSLFQSWYAYSSYKINSETGRLEEIQDMYYPYGETIKDDYSSVSSKIYDENWPASYTSKAVNLYSQPDQSSDTVLFEAQKFAATATDNKNWVYLVGESGVSGWLYYENNNVYDENGEFLEFGNNAYIDAVTGERFIDGFNEEGTYYAEVFCDLLMYD